MKIQVSFSLHTPVSPEILKSSLQILHNDIPFDLYLFNPNRHFEEEEFSNLLLFEERNINSIDINLKRGELTENDMETLFQILTCDKCKKSLTSFKIASKINKDQTLDLINVLYEMKNLTTLNINNEIMPITSIDYLDLSEEVVKWLFSLNNHSFR
jgi:hypothetical protein